MTPDHLTLLAAVIAAAGGGGGIVAWAKYRGESKIAEFRVTLDGFKDLLSAEREHRQTLETRVDDLRGEIRSVVECKRDVQRRLESETAVSVTAIGHIVLLRGLIEAPPRPPLLIEARVLRVEKTGLDNGNSEGRCEA